MPIARIFPEKDATLYSIYPNLNSGLDELLELGSYVGADVNPLPQVARFLIKFNNTELMSIFDEALSHETSSNPIEVKLRLFLADVKGIALDTIVDLYGISGSWGMGTGKLNDQPETQNGTSWIWRDYSGSQYWIPGGGSGSYESSTTGSYSSSVDPGGGTWYPSTICSQSLTPSTYVEGIGAGYLTNKDLDFDVKNILIDWYIENYDNNGFIIKLRNEFINNVNYQPQLKYFSTDTNTIYTPYIDIKWDDYLFVTGSSSMSIANTSQLTLTINQNQGYFPIFTSGSYNKIRINCRPTYPTRVFQTSSVYTKNYYLPPVSSSYCIKDLYTNETIINFDPRFTKISADATSSYFNLNMGILEPERYYKILIKTVINNEILIYDDNFHFKVIN